jgi:hypothetical protein
MLPVGGVTIQRRHFVRRTRANENRLTYAAFFADFPARQMRQRGEEFVKLLTGDVAESL